MRCKLCTKQNKTISLFCRIFLCLTLAGCTRKKTLEEKIEGDGPMTSVKRYREIIEPKKEELPKSTPSVVSNKPVRRAPIRNRPTRFGSPIQKTGKDFLVEAPFSCEVTYKQTSPETYEVELKNKDGVTEIVKNVGQVNTSKKFFKQGERVGIIKKSEQNNQLQGSPTPIGQQSNMNSTTPEISQQSTKINSFSQNTFSDSKVNHSSKPTPVEATVEVNPAAAKIVPEVTVSTRDSGEITSKTNTDTDSSAQDKNSEPNAN